VPPPALMISPPPPTSATDVMGGVRTRLLVREVEPFLRSQPRPESRRSGGTGPTSRFHRSTTELTKG
jgi:hypothetical protein